LTGASDVRTSAFAKAFPDQSQWFSRSWASIDFNAFDSSSIAEIDCCLIAGARFSKLAVKGSNDNLKVFLQRLNYSGPPEMFSMYACLLLPKAMRLRIDWYTRHQKSLRDRAAKHALNHPVHLLPELNVAMELSSHA
jgi:hypothetical protein